MFNWTEIDPEQLKSAMLDLMDGQYDCFFCLPLKVKILIHYCPSSKKDNNTQE